MALIDQDDLRPAHHAGSSKQGVIDRICADVAAAALESDLGNDKVVDVLQIVANHLLGDTLIASTDDKVACCTLFNFIRNVTGERELSIAPSNVNLVHC